PFLVVALAVCRSLAAGIRCRATALRAPSCAAGRLTLLIMGGGCCAQAASAAAVSPAASNRSARRVPEDETLRGPQPIRCAPPRQELLMEDIRTPPTRGPTRTGGGNHGPMTAKFVGMTRFRRGVVNLPHTPRRAAHRNKRRGIARMRTRKSGLPDLRALKGKSGLPDLRARPDASGPMRDQVNRALTNRDARSRYAQWLGRFRCSQAAGIS